MNSTERELWKALDYAVFGTNDPEDLRQGMDRVRQQYLKERSSLGHFLASLRDTEERSVEQMAKEAGVPADQWRMWEMDYVTPTAEELRQVAKRLCWRPRKSELVAKLREEAPRYRLSRLTSFRPEVLAACGVLDQGGLAWNSIDPTMQSRICQWGAEHGYSFPNGLARFFKELNADSEAKEAWINDILGG